MSKIKEIISKYSLTFISLNIFITLLILMPKDFSEIFGLPVRLGLLSLLLLLIFIDKKKNKIEFNNIKPLYIYILTGLFLVSSIPSIFVSKALFTSIYTLIKFGSLFILLFILLKLKFKKGEYKILLGNLIICSFLLCVYSVFDYIFDINLMTKNAGLNYYPGAKGRASATFFNTIYYGIFINTIFSIVFYLLNIVNKKKNIIALLLICSLLYLSLLFTFTRSAIVVFIGIFTILIIFLNKLLLKKRNLVLLLILVVITLLLPGADSLTKKAFDDVYTMISKTSTLINFMPSVEKKETVNPKPKKEYVAFDENSDLVDYSLQHRESFALIAKEIANDNLLKGVGFGAYIDYMNSKDFDINYPEYNIAKTHPHSSIILSFAEIGIIGMCLLAVIFGVLAFIPFIYMIRNYKENKNVYYIAVLAFAIACGFVIVNFMSENAIYDTQMSYIFVTVYSLLIGYCFANDKKKVMFISSTGGHLSELLQLSPLLKKYDSCLITEKTKSNLSLKNKYNKVYYLVYGTRHYKFSYMFKFLYNIFKSFILYIKERPNVIITTGTHTAVPMCYIGKLFGSKVIFIETFANSKTKTLSGRLVYPIADTFIVQWKEMLKLYPKATYGGWIY